MFLTHSVWLNLLIIIGLVGGAEEVVRRLIGKPIVRAWLKVEKFLDTWNGEPARDGLEARPGLVDRMVSMEGRMISIEYQVHNNGGGSLKDGVDKGVKIAREGLEVATATKDALDEHVAQSARLIANGEIREQRIWDALDTRRALDNLTEALPIVARSTPHEEDAPGA